jgi:outer membrane protein OmpA-like peptidoglycan-associated protein
MKLFISVIVMSLLSQVADKAVVLKWDIPLKERLEIVRTARVRFLVNDKLQKIYDERNIIDLTCYERKSDSSSVKGLFSVYQRNAGHEVFQLQKQYPAEFIINGLGRYAVPIKMYVPNLRHIPTFEGKEILKGDSWTAEAELLLHDFSVPFKLIFPVEYRLADIREKDDGEVAVIKFRFLIDYSLAGGKYPADFPAKIEGSDEGDIYWDVLQNRPVSMNEKYRVAFFFPAGNSKIDKLEFQMHFETRMSMYAPVTPEEKEQARRELKKEVPDGVEVDIEKRGIVLRLGDVLFDFDSSVMRSQSKEKLDIIINALRQKYPDREIIVEGHTDNIGEKEYNERLSKDRARTVAEYLKSKMKTDKLSYRGFGAGSPIADNASRAGRQKNRRVEIIIKLQ